MRSVAVSHELDWRGRPKRDRTSITLFCDCPDCLRRTGIRLYVHFDVHGYYDLDDATRLLGLVPGKPA
jgi:hypothetical protein